MENFTRTINLMGEDKFLKLAKSRVAVFGIGGVGGYVCEGLARCGIGEITIVDYDNVSESNINRQIIATYKTIGKSKTDIMKQRILDINPNARVVDLQININKNNINEFDFSKYDFVVDAIDTVTSKILIIEKAKKQNANVISCMGTGNKFDCTKLKIDDIAKTSMCPLAKVMRKELKDRNIKNVPVLYSLEQPVKQGGSGERKVTPNSIVFVPSVAGLMIAQYVIYKIMEK